MYINTTETLGTSWGGRITLALKAFHTTVHQNDPKQCERCSSHNEHCSFPLHVISLSWRHCQDRNATKRSKVRDSYRMASLACEDNSPSCPRTHQQTDAYSALPEKRQYKRCCSSMVSILTAHTCINNSTAVPRYPSSSSAPLKPDKTGVISGSGK